MPVTVVPTSFATVAIDTFITELSSVIRNCPAASVSRTSAAPRSRVEGTAASELPTALILPWAVEESKSRGQIHARSGGPDRRHSVERSAYVYTARTVAASTQPCTTIHGTNTTRPDR